MSKLSLNDVCVLCGKNYVPEGSHICPVCEKAQNISNYDYNKVSNILNKKVNNLDGKK